jgi:hypothetical protein
MKSVQADMWLSKVAAGDDGVSGTVVPYALPNAVDTIGPESAAFVVCVTSKQKGSSL